MFAASHGLDAVLDSAFFRWGYQFPKQGPRSTIFSNYSQKLYGNERNWTKRGVYPFPIHCQIQGGTRVARPRVGPISFIFMQFFWGKVCQKIFYHPIGGSKEGCRDAPWGPISFIFMQFWGKNCKIVPLLGVGAHTLRLPRPPPEKSQIRRCTSTVGVTVPF